VDAESQLGQQKPHHFRGGEQVHFEYLAACTGAEIDELATRSDTGIVHEYIEAAELSAGFFEQSLSILGLSNIRNDCRQRPAKGVRSCFK